MAITIKLMGGMANQMWQYAFGLAQARRLGVKLQLDATHLGGKRPFNLPQWSLKELTTTSRQVPTILEEGMNYNQPLVDRIKDGDVLQGYWQNERYILPVEKELREIFVPFCQRLTDIGSQIVKDYSVAVHVRRGDYLIEPHKSFHGNLEWQTYYKPAMDYIRERVADPTFFIFTDDPEWVRENWYTGFSLGTQVVMQPSDESTDIYTMSCCQHAIIANSSFSWWGAWLGDGQKDRIVVAPKQWFAEGAGQDYSDIVPDRWVKM